jgi:polyhydroxyalkanoate synthesis repressor PhaR
MKKLVIKRYQNRRLFDTTHEQFITYKDIVDLLKKGFQVVILDHRLKKDITMEVFAQILFQQEREWLEKRSLEGLARMIASTNIPAMSAS